MEVYLCLESIGEYFLSPFATEKACRLLLKHPDVLEQSGLALFW